MRTALALVRNRALLAVRLASNPVTISSELSRLTVQYNGEGGGGITLKKRFIVVTYYIADLNIFGQIRHLICGRSD